MRVKIEVTEMDIKRGKRGDICKCPIARATNRLLKSARVTGFATLYLNTKRDRSGISRSYVLPKKAYNFVQCYDSHKAVKPFSFTVNVDPIFVRSN